MRRIFLLAATFVLVLPATGLAQGWMYQSGASGTPPFAYGDPYGNLYSQPNTSNFPPPAYSIPPSSFQLTTSSSIPRIESYIPAPSRAPSSYPCTLPIGCD